MPTNTVMTANTYNSILHEVTIDFLQKLDKNNIPSAGEIETKLLDAIAIRIKLVNATRKSNGDSALKIPDVLNFAIIAEILAYLYPICCINTAAEASDPEYDLLAIYQTDGENKGIYTTDENAFRRIIEQYNYTITTKELKECLLRLRALVPRKERTTARNLIPLNNGIFDYDTKELLPFSHEYVFLSKSKVNYNPNATNVILHNDNDNTDWDVDSWMNELSDDPEVVTLLWEVLGAIIRPNVRWNKSAWFYSTKGNNGKGTLCELMRQLCGQGSYASIPLADMGKDFILEPLTRASAIIVDENDVGTYIDKAANLKAIVTNDIIQINRKFKMPIPYRFYGFMVQCLNEMPRVKDRSDSFYRRQLFIPFTKCFTGHERKYIKEDYLHRPEVLEYVLLKVLHMNYYTLSTPQSCMDALNEYKEFNDPVREFADEILSQCTWNVLPFTFVYDLYRAWFQRNMPSGKVQNRPSFINDLIAVLNNSDTWICTSRKQQIRTKQSDFPCEPMIQQYELTNWVNPKYKHSAATMTDRCTPGIGQIPDRVRGLQRIISVTTDDDDQTT